jgi:hypothetical protein
MIRSKIVAVAFAVLCGLALQFQVDAARARSATLISGGSPYPGFALRSSTNHTLILQANGNVVLYDSNNAPIWATNTAGIAPRNFIMQADGNLVLYSTDGVARWASDTWNNPGAFLNVQDDGNIVVYRYGSQSETGENALWASGTNGR